LSPREALGPLQIAAVGGGDHDPGAGLDVGRHHDAGAVFQLGRLVGRRRGLTLHHRVGLHDFHGHALGKGDADRVALVGFDRHGHAVLQEDDRFADHLLAQRNLIVGLVVHEAQHAVSLGVEELEGPLV
jgi:hypothetical protein